MFSLKWCKVLLVVGLFFIGESQAAISRNIVIGVIYNDDYESLGNTLKYLIEYEINDDNNKLLPRAYRFKTVMVNSKGTNLLSRGVAAKLSTAACIFDLYSNDPDAFALGDMLRIPLIMADNLNDDPPNKYVLSMRPHYSVISQALYDMAMYFKFDEVAIVYDVRKTRLASHFYAKARTENRFDVHLIPELDLKDPKKTASSLQILLTTYIKNVILICDQKDMAQIMNQVLRVGINEQGYKWLSSDVEVAGANKTYPSILGMVGLSLHLSGKDASRNFEMISSSVGGGVPLAPVVYAAMNDSLRMVTRVIKSLITAGIWPEIYPITSSDNCPLKKTPSIVGPKLLEPLKTITHRGLTGLVSFDSNGKRRSERTLDILNIGEDGVDKAGLWNPNPKDNENAITMKNANPIKWVGDFAELVKCHNPGKPGKKFRKPRNILRITAVIEPPFLEWSNGSIEARPVFNTSLQGFCLDILNELSRKVGFDYEILLRKDTNYGKRVQGKWTGMLGDLIQKKADLALAPITITSEREQLIDFSKPFWDFSMSLIMQKETEEEVQLFAFVKPFDGLVWLLTIGVVLFVTIMMYAVDVFSPFGHRAEARDTGEGAGDEFNLFNSLWFATASMLQQGGDNTPKSPSGRILAAAFWFFILIILSTYTANLAAFFTIKQSKRSINSLQDLVKQDKIKYGVLNSGAMKSFFESSQVALYRQMFSQMRQQNSFVSSTKEGVARVRAGGYAYLTEQPYLDYYNQRKPCNTMLLENLLTAKSYGFGLQRNSPYVNELSVAILDLRENGFIEKTRAKWWDERSECAGKKKDGGGSTTSLGIQNMAGVFIILLGGVAFSFLLVVIEIKCKRIVNMLTKNTGSSREVSRSQTIQSNEASRDNINANRIPVRVVVSQGPKQLKPVVIQEQPAPPQHDEAAGWRAWFGRWI